MRKEIVMLFCCAMLVAVPSCGRRSANQSAVTEQPVKKAKPLYTVKTLPISVTSNILENIEKQYKGSVTLIDCWATWCGPCRMAMAAIDSIKPALQKKGVKFVYITGETSPLATWKQMLPSIAGDHYRLTAEQWRALGEEQKMRGIPCYKLLNADGTEAFSNLTEGGYPGNEFMKGEIDKALQKK